MKRIRCVFGRHEWVQDVSSDRPIFSNLFEECSYCKKCRDKRIAKMGFMNKFLLELGRVLVKTSGIKEEYNEDD